jgi:transposase
VGLTVLTHLPELGTLDRKRITALAGLAPFACESGLQRGRRAIWGGRGDARAMLFLAAQSAARWNVPLRLFYERLVGRGKSKKAALAAVARKLLIAINAMMRDQRPWKRRSSPNPVAARPGDAWQSSSQTGSRVGGAWLKGWEGRAAGLWLNYQRFPVASGDIPIGPQWSQATIEKPANRSNPELREEAFRDPGRERCDRPGIGFS